MKLKVIERYPAYVAEDDKKSWHTFTCKDDNGQTRRVDLTVGGCFPDDFDTSTLIGKTVQCEGTHPFIEIADGKVEVVDNVP